MTAPAERLRAAADLIERTGAAAMEVAPPWEIIGASVGSWIALLGPDTAPALAAWLRETADDAAQVERINAAAMERAERVGGDGHTFVMYHALIGPAVAFADLILRGES